MVSSEHIASYGLWEFVFGIAMIVFVRIFLKIWLGWILAGIMGQFCIWLIEDSE